MLAQLARVTPFTLRSRLTIHRCSQIITFAQCSTHTAAASIPQAPAYSGRRPAKLPEELSRNLLVLSCASSAEGGVCDVYVLGTCHVSEQSWRQAQAVVSYLKPEVVYLELCQRRRGVLTRKTLKVPTEEEIIAALLKREHSMFEVLCGWIFAEIGSKVGVIPGSEFRVAYEEANKYGGKVVLGDRPIKITLKRTWSKMPLWHKTKLLCYCLFPPLRKLSNNFDDLCKMGKMLNDSDPVIINKLLNDNDFLNHCLQTVGKEFPTVVETILHERDQYMSSMLLQTASKRRSVVAVVGKGHLEGIKKHWKQPVADDLMEAPSSEPGPATRVWKMLTNTLKALVKELPIKKN